MPNIVRVKADFIFKIDNDVIIPTIIVLIQKKNFLSAKLILYIILERKGDIVIIPINEYTNQYVPSMSSLRNLLIKSTMDFSLKLDSI